MSTAGQMRRAALARHVAVVGGSTVVKPRAALAAYTAAAAVPLVSAASSPSPARAYAPAPTAISFVRSANPTNSEGSMSPAGTDESTGTVYYSQHLDPFEKAHETGHVFDAQELTSADRLRLEQIMGFGKGRWDQGTGTGGYNSPDEWFADYYAAAATNMNLRKQGVSSYAQLDPGRLKRFESVLAAIGRRRNLQPYQP